MSLSARQAAIMPNFRTSARTVDMLGRQQIAGIPTAISELFKNAHDAYATRVEADYYRPEQLLVLRDDGLGMTPNDIVERWLVLGTDSKVGNGGELDAIGSAMGLEARIPRSDSSLNRLDSATKNRRMCRTDPATATAKRLLTTNVFRLSEYGT